MIRGLRLSLVIVLAIACVGSLLSCMQWWLGPITVFAAVAVWVWGLREPHKQSAIVYGAVGGATLFVGICLLFAAINHEWPFHHNKTASQTMVAIARRFAPPAGGCVGAMIGLRMAARSKRADSR